ncbi:SMC family ATPase [Clostridium carnis]
MRPIKLIMSAFGPYANKQVIDFNKLEGQNIFLVTGPTGAGKTTIFDAISYALFGVASGSVRENDSLRSDFAKDEDETYVQLEFEFRGEVYLVKRAPQQFKKKKKGEGYTSHGAEGELHLPNEKIITKYSAVTEKIEEILGINKEQFKQIVMLPQGEFRKLLLSESKDREAIFRKIFGTYDYQAIQMRLKDKALAIKQEVDRGRTEVDSNLKGIKSDDNVEFSQYEDTKVALDKIEEILNIDNREIKELDKKLKDIKDKKGKANEDLIRGSGNNDLLKEKEYTETKLTEYFKRKEEIDDKKQLSEKGKKALEIEIIESSYLEKVKNKEDNKKELERIEKELILKGEELERCRKNLELEEKNECQRENINKEILLLEEKLNKLYKIDERKKILESLRHNHNEIVNNIETFKEKRKNNILKQEQNELMLKEINQLEKELIELNNNENEKKRVREQLLKVYKEITSLNELKIEYNNKSNKFKEIEKCYTESKNYYDRLELNFRKGQAGILAEALKEGTECPVCGSKEHPMPAIKQLNVPSEYELKNQKEKYEKIKNETDEYLNSIKVLSENIKLKSNEIIIPALEQISNVIGMKLEFNNNLIKDIKEIGGKIRLEIDNLIKRKIEIEVIIKNKFNIEKEVEILKLDLKVLEESLEVLEKNKLDTFGKLQAEEEALKTLGSDIPNEFSSLNNLNDIINNKKNILEDMKKSLQNAKIKESNISKEYSILNGNKNTIEKVLKNSIEKENQEKLRYQEKLIELEFIDIEEYKKYKISKDEINKIDAFIKDYEENLRSLKDKFNNLCEKTKDIKFKDLSNLNEEITNYSLIEKELEEKIKLLYAKIANNDSRYKIVKKLSENLIRLEEKYKVVGELANLSNGRQSPYITFESYVLAAYFQEIIDAANLRLSKMTGERFILKRKEDKSKGTGQKGLELEVFDNYTGKLRHVKTLSGGESFKASLSLALGLSDVIQSSSGGIKLDTMFVDEGFGTLDPESLDNAISCLLELQMGGRLVGIISHVPELKERVEKKLEIKATTEGSFANFN